MQKVKLLFLLLAMVAVVSSCKKDKSKTDHLTDGPWKILSMTLDPPLTTETGVQITDFLAQLNDCTKDDLVIFNSNGNVSFDEGPTKCDSADPQSYIADWTFNSDETIISITFPGGDAESWTVTELNEDNLTTTSILDLGDGINYTATARYNH